MIWCLQKENIIIKIKNILNVEKYVPVLKPSSVSGKEKDIYKPIRKVPRSDKDIKAPVQKPSSLHEHGSYYSSS